ncbi:hypothetical protein EZ437_16955 [Pedobacter psychroterrae]|uniref:KilA-N DNA-binding domain-containing protein n=1 Tax=Pedobacter psychroterrae TaxID=2530453 RepID=A0A4R0NJD3_9SPHI|nr:hypothetical protein EZ437_16955 [Pedobacter psychroterrae]
MTLNDAKDLKPQVINASNKRGSHTKYLSNVFSEQGLAMLASVLKSDKAVVMSVQIMRAFVAMRKFLKDNAEVLEIGECGAKAVDVRV